MSIIPPSIWEKNSRTRRDTDSGIAFATVMSVTPKTRRCSVRTWSGPAGLEDCVFDDCQWLSWDASVDGDESTCTPRAGATVLVVAVSGSMYILGAIRPVTVDGEAIYGNELGLREGDKMLATRALNRITLRSNQLVEVVAKPGTLQQIFYPKDDTIATLARNSSIILNGGRSEWKFSNETFTSLKKELVRKDLFQAMVLIEEKGHVDLTKVYRNTIGTLPPGATEIPLPIFQETIDMFGSREIQINSAAGTGGIKINQDGLGPFFSMVMGLVPQFSIDINGITGDTAVNINKLIDINLSGVDGTFGIKNLIGEVEVTGTGDISAKNKVAEITASASGDIAVKNKTAEVSIAASGDIEVKNTTGGSLKIDAGGMVALGNKQAELLDLLDKLIDEVTNITTNLSTETHIGNMGLPTAPDPAQKQKYTEALGKVTEIKTSLSLIKGSL